MGIGAQAPAAWPDEEPFGPVSLQAHTRASVTASEPVQEGSGAENEDEDQDLKHCPTTLDACPLSGCAVPGNGKARSNEIKHGDPAHRPPNTRPITVPIEVFDDLQAASDHVIPQGAYPPPEKRELIRSLDIRGHRIGEGALVKITGYLRQMRPEGPESVNCKLKKTANNDFHLSVVASPEDDEFHGIVVEMIPQGRPSSWTTAALHKVRDAHTQILVVGQLFYDSKHVVNRGPSPIEGQPRRFSLWEVHPVQRFFVCERESCSPASPDGWREWL